MIESMRWHWFARWLARHARKRIEGRFGLVRAAGLEVIEQAKKRGPILFVSNHTSWWDPMVTMMLAVDHFDLDGYAMMDAKNLRELGFFARAGAFGVDPNDARDGVRAIRYAAKLLDRPGRAVWIYPQGSERPIDERPLDFQPGAAAVARAVDDVSVIPIAVHYRFGGTEYPEMRIAVGEPIEVSRNLEEGRMAQSEAVENGLDRVAQDILGEDVGFVTLFSRHQPRVTWVERLLTRMVGGPTTDSVPVALPEAKPAEPKPLAPAPGPTR